MKKTHFVLDLFGVSDNVFLACLTPETWSISDMFFTRIIEREDIKILNKTVHFFDGPVGAMTCLYLLSESHFSLHTFPEEQGRICLDLFTCGDNDVERILLQIVVFFKPDNYIIEAIDRDREDVVAFQPEG